MNRYANNAFALAAALMVTMMAFYEVVTIPHATASVTIEIA